MDITGKIKEFYKNNSRLIKTILIILVLIFLVSSGVLNWFQDRWNEDLSSERDRLEEMNKQLKKSVKALEKQFADAQLDITELQHTSDSLAKEYALKELEMAQKEEKYKKEIERLKEIPPEKVYEELNVYYPSRDNPLEYPFALNQIRMIHRDYFRLQYNISLNSDLSGQVNNLNLDLRTKNNIIRNKDVQIGTLRTEVELNKTYINNLQSNQANLQRSYRSERRSKRIWMGVAGAELAYILISSFNN